MFSAVSHYLDRKASTAVAIYCLARRVWGAR